MAPRRRCCPTARCSWPRAGTAVIRPAPSSTTSALATLTVAVSEATLSSPVYTNKQFQLTVSQVSSLTYVVQANTNLSGTNWVALVTNAAPFTFTDTTATNYSQRFYRALYRP